MEETEEAGLDMEDSLVDKNILVSLLKEKIRKPESCENVQTEHTKLCVGHPGHVQFRGHTGEC